LGRWFEQYPERLEHELQALRDAGFDPRVDEGARAQGLISLSIKCSIKGVDHTFEVRFPPGYPYFPFQVFAPSLDLERHQDPYSKALCFIARIESEWRVDDTVAQYLREQLPQILKANESDGPFAGERQEGAPVTPYFCYQSDSVVLIGDWELSPEQTHGRLQLSVDRWDVTNVLIRGAVKQISDQKGNLIGELDVRLSSLFPRPAVGRWVRLPARPYSNHPAEILREAERAWPALGTPHFDNGKDILGIAFPDEVRYREWRNNWIFLIRERAGNPRRRAHNQQQQLRVSVVRADHAGRADLVARVPTLVSLENRHAAIFGLGALGSMVTWQLARAGVGQLSIVDYDFVNAGTTPRWIYGMSAVGRNKATVLLERLRAEYPLVKVSPIIARLGNAYPTREDEYVAAAIANVEAIVDCTVEKTVHHYLSSLAWARKIPYIWSSATPGGWGGIVGRIQGRRDAGCWKCFLGHLVDKRIAEPEAEGGSDVQMAGCDSPTFRGAGFDMDEISLMCARLTAATLCDKSPGSYGDFDWDVATVNLRKDGQPIAPAWHTYTLLPSDDCDEH
jgi:molybdopterin/thiamine biosynthesis adenylyltransferase